MICNDFNTQSEHTKEGAAVFEYQNAIENTY